VPGVPGVEVTVECNPVDVTAGLLGAYRSAGVTRVSLGVFPSVLNPHHPLPGDPDYAGRAVKIRNYLRLNTKDIVLGLANGGSIARRSGDKVSIVAGAGFLYTASSSRRLAPGPVEDLSGRAIVRT